ncbi:MAG: hypothetical protein ACREK6_03750 [Candidatus Rokuibacteriota bacterium]
MTRRAMVVTTTGLGLVLTTAGPVAAATIYGTIQEGGRPLEKATVELSCDGKRQSQQTDARGTYRFTVSRTGRCQLHLQGGSAPVIVYDEPTRYDFEVRQEDGRRRLIRR